MNETSRNFHSKVEPLDRRLTEVEAVLHQIVKQTSSADLDPPEAPPAATASRLPSVPEREFAPTVSEHRQRLIGAVDKLWANGTTLKYYLFTSSPLRGSRSNEKLVRDAFAIWKDVGIGIDFVETPHMSEAELRIGFLRGDGHWSYVGRDNLHVPGQAERTMNIGSELKHDPRGVDVAVREIGHALGLPHAHQTPNSGPAWNERAVIDPFAGHPTVWSEPATRRTPLDRLPAWDADGTEWDPDSIMHYAFGPGVIDRPVRYRDGLTPDPRLGGSDLEQIRKVYPPLKARDHTRLIPFETQDLALSHGEQANFTIVADETRDYAIRVLGAVDTLLVLFRKDAEELRFMAGADDSGRAENSGLQVRLERGASYVLRVRMLAPYGGTRAAVLLW